ncbi:MAG: hypothetical protein QOG13_2519 [Sphingomonadales bacterium]|nr:hypothetical protein [Sphingomonadales bacterium]MEA3043762.1 hypothetical protein [Sphingomonadales bacterium]
MVAAAGLAGASPTRRGALSFLALELVLILSFAWEFVQVSFVHPSSTGGLVFLSWPLLQWAAVAVAFPVALAFGWRMRPDFLKG